MCNELWNNSENDSTISILFFVDSNNKKGNIPLTLENVGSIYGLIYVCVSSSS
jgi:hypothetical protein